MRIYVDPGHGGVDPGAIGRDPAEAREADIVWAVALALIAELERRGSEVKLSRLFGRTHARIPLADRAAQANSWRADLFLSIHCNSFASSTANGVEVLHFGSERGRALAESIRASMAANGLIGPGTLFRDRGLKLRPGLAVLRLTRMPAVLVELPFVSNRSNLSKLLDGKVQVRFAHAVARGATAFVSS